MTADPLIGRDLAGYHIERVVGRGGMGVVYLARDPDLDRSVALKVLSPALSYQSSFRDRFIAESRRAAALEHPAIVPIYRAGDADGQLFIAMRYVESDLAALVRAGPLAVERTLWICRQIAAALDAAHAKGLVHRDVKPANILVEDGPGGVRAFLADFGLTKRVADHGTRTGELVGTLDYVAPEHVEGRPIDGRSDQYSLACVLYECLTGTTPYAGESEAAVLWSHMHGAIPRASLARPQVPLALDAAIARGMAKDPADRHGSCSALMAGFDAGTDTVAAATTPAGSTTTAVPPADGATAGTPPLEPARPDPEGAARARRDRVRERERVAIRTTALARRVAELCERMQGQLPPGSLADRVATIRGTLGEPLRVAVVGRVNAGKSTLVNALIRESLARTGAAETTRIVTWFRYGFPERVTVRTHDGREWDLPLGTAVRLPAELGAGPDEIERATIWLSVEALRRLTIIDTPGLASASVEVSRRTAALLGIDGASRDAIAQADAVLFVVAHPLSQDETEALADIRRQAGGPRISAVNTLGVLSKADLIGGTGGPGTPDPAQVAAGLADRLRATLATVVPVIGLLAETSETGRFTETDAAHLRTLAGLGEVARRRMLISADRFRAFDSAVPADAREGLLASLDLYGLRLAMDAIDRGTSDAASLAELLRRESGLAALQDLVDEVFAARADAIKADRALLDLERLAYRAEGVDPAILARLRTDLETVRLLPELHTLDELRALQECTERDAAVPAELEAELRRLLGGGTSNARLGIDDAADAVTGRERAQRSAGRWRAYANGDAPSSIAARVADVVARSYEIIWSQLDEGTEMAR